MKKNNNQRLANYLINKIEEEKKLNVSKESVLNMMENNVFSHPDFKRQILEASQKLDVPSEKVDFVIKHFLNTMAIQMSLVTRIRRRLSIYAFFMIEIKDRASRMITETEENLIKKIGKRNTTKVLSIFKK